MGNNNHKWEKKHRHPCMDCGELCYYNAARCFSCAHIFHNNQQRKKRKEKMRARSNTYEESKKIPCPICGKPINRRSSFCIEHRKKTPTGYNSPNWRGGKIPYNGEWAKFREVARKRAKGNCQSCGKSESDNGRRLDTHHKKEIRRFLIPEVSHDDRNLICLCRKCHAKLHHPKGSVFSRDLASVSLASLSLPGTLA